MSFSAPGSPPPGSPPPADPVPQPTPPPGSAAYAQPVPHQPLPGFAPQPVKVLRSPRGLATATNVLLAVSGLYALILTGTGLYVSSVLGDGQYPDAGADDSLSPPDVWMGVITAVSLPLLLATAALFIIWFHRVHQNAEILNPGAVTRSSGWAIGGWFIPIGNLFLPYLMAKEIWAASIQLGPDGSYRRVSTAPVTSWWLLWVASLIADRVFSSLYTVATTAEELASSADAAAVQGGLSLVAAVLAIGFVHKVTALQGTKAAQGPYAAA
ncbi:DUF4328 domain-containing protein [Streptomyces sp. NBC_00096]|uniref:DUF4328 domain-containing protein n=1 Tax=Streptomyces sp. NBC_00096 TaxID=2975650 RepID=UPI00324D5C85